MKINFCFHKCPLWYDYHNKLVQWTSHFIWVSVCSCSSKRHSWQKRISESQQFPEIIKEINTSGNSTVETGKWPEVEAICFPLGNEKVLLFNFSIIFEVNMLYYWVFKLGEEARFSAYAEDLCPTTFAINSQPCPSASHFIIITIILSALYFMPQMNMVLPHYTSVFLNVLAHFTSPFVKEETFWGFCIYLIMLILNSPQ